ncbi:hypothetical protein ACOCGD_001655 [Vibrio cholerae]|uniref:RelA/SpoT domain-containing protein n=1 Tax=Vibrio metoecus TaxID=1481663 RepID=UPI000BA8DEAE|nr:RelA/SpoT domain-containing protein [Vibrio metoecus]ELF6906540.1 hypothetical protein [Vibrio cholerae]PAR34711.1 (p)ppGpp synthetase [Vibrio metoecus]PAR43672.1 (p)ppGpp synthetase [Vibrio metoecus]HAS3608259.1 (p)ppGpp synthetase [Vibrio cholerae]
MSYQNEDIINLARDHERDFGFVHDRVMSILTRDNDLSKLIHSLKSRVKDPAHLDEKLTRKNNELAMKGLPTITVDNFFEKVTDVVGIRVLHLHMEQFEFIHKALMKYVEMQDLTLFEEPKAYTWDPEYKVYFDNLGIKAQQKESFYTSVHYVFQLRKDYPYTCELQVRTLFEEAWGEIDHTMNYPEKINNIAVQEQLKVLARIVGAGSRLSDSIFKVYNGLKG